MDKERFVALLEDALRAPKGTIRVSDVIRDLEGWDSIGALAVIAMVDEEYRVTLDVGALRSCKTVDDLAMLVQNGVSAR